MDTILGVILSAGIGYILGWYLGKAKGYSERERDEELELIEKKYLQESGGTPTPKRLSSCDARKQWGWY